MIRNENKIPLRKKYRKIFFPKFYIFLTFYRVVFHAESIGAIFKYNSQR
jgi:hypothetical protein